MSIGGANVPVLTLFLVEIESLVDREIIVDRRTSSEAFSRSCTGNGLKV